MDAVAEAKRYLADYEEYKEKRAKNPDRLSVDPENFPAVAQAYAAIAQAEQLKRIADALYFPYKEGQFELADILYAIYEVMDKRAK